MVETPFPESQLVSLPVIVVVPGAIEVASPLEPASLLMVATPVFDEVQNV